MRNPSLGLEVIQDVSFAAGPERFIVSSRYAEFALEIWQMKAKFPVLRKPVGNNYIGADK